MKLIALKSFAYSVDGYTNIPVYEGEQIEVNGTLAQALINGGECKQSVEKQAIDAPIETKVIESPKSRRVKK